MSIGEVALPRCQLIELSAPHFTHRFDSGLPHSGQNFLPDVLSVPHLEQLMSVVQFVQQRLCVFKVRQVEAFGEPVVNFRELLASLLTAIGVAQEARETRRRA